MTYPVMDIPAPPGHGRCLQRSAAVWIPGMADVSREVTLCGFRAEALHYGKHISLRRYIGLRPMGSTVGADTRGGCVVTGPYTDLDGQLSSVGKYMNTET